MRELTKTMKLEAKKDIVSIHSHNNSLASRRTADQIEQSRADRYNYFYKKWNSMLQSSETQAQKNICSNVIGNLKYIR